MRTQRWTRMISVLVLAGMLWGTVACSDAEPANSMVADTAGTTDTVANPDENGEDTEDTRFRDVDYGGREFRVYTSIDATDATNANNLIEGSGELNGDIVNDAVYDRNLAVEEMLGVKLVFTPANFTYDTANAGLRQLVMAGSDDFDLIINDLRALAALSVEGLFHQISNKTNFDFQRNYWYNDYMDDLALIPGYNYVMAGDYFMDIIASCHALFYNKDIIENYYGDPDYIYQLVIDGRWTYDALTEISMMTYYDLNGNNQKDGDDQFGFAIQDSWGSAIPFVGSSGTQFIDRSSGVPEFNFNNERSVTYLEKLNDLWYSPGTLLGVPGSTDAATGLRQLFADGRTTVVGYQRLGDLAKMRDIEFSVGVIPYPKLFETDEYVTSTHDTTEVGVIPVTCLDTDFATTVIEVLNRETAVMVMPQYYETALKVKYTTDTLSATMIDIIHDSFGATFPLAFNDSTGTIMLHSFTDPLGAKSTDFASQYKKKEKAAKKSLESMVEKAISVIS